MRRTPLALLLLFGFSSWLTAQPMANGQGAMLKHEVYLLEFIGGGGRLTAAERVETAQAIANAAHADPQTWSDIAANEQSSVQEIEQNNPSLNHARREASRYN